MANNYKININAPNGTLTQVYITKTGFFYLTEPTAPLYGTVSITPDGADDPFSRIRGQVASIVLDADTGNPLTDLYTDIERQWEVRIIRRSVIEFAGWLNPEGIIEDYVADRWITTLVAEDGLGSLENKAYVNADGDPYTDGKQKLREILRRALLRTGFDWDICFQCRTNSNANYPVEVLDGALAGDFFEQTVDQRVFMNGEEPASSITVVKEIMKAANGYIFSRKGQWYINWSLQFANPSAVNNTMRYSKYVLGTGSPIAIYETVDYTVGPQQTSTERHWVNENQSIERRPSIGAAKISMNLTDPASINTNPDLNNNGSTISGWTAAADARVNLDGDSGVEIDSGGSFIPLLTSASSVQDVALQDSVGVEIDLTTTDADQSVVFLRVRVEITDGVTPYYLRYSDPASGDGELEWTTSTTTDGSDTHLLLGLDGGPGDYNAKVQSPPVPVEGSVVVKIYPQSVALGIGAIDALYRYIAVFAIPQSQPESIDHTSERIAAPSSYIESLDEAKLTDWQGYAFKGTLYQPNGTGLTDDGYSRPVAPALSYTELWRAGVTDRAFLRMKPSRLFRGDLYGWIPYNCRLTIQNFPGIYWAITDYTWSADLDIVTVAAFELHWDRFDVLEPDNVLDDIRYTKKVNYGKAIEPTIKG